MTKSLAELKPDPHDDRSNDAQMSKITANPKINLSLKSFLIFGSLICLVSSCKSQIARNPTPLLASLETPDRLPLTPFVVPTPEPFRFNLPTPGAQPISGWRPPLYPVPWALSPYDHFYFARPIAADQVNWPLPNYRYGGVFFANVVHTGVDIPAPEGTTIMAAAAGTVIWANWGLFTEAPDNKSDPYGLAVAIRHDFGYKEQQLFTIYAHMSRIDAVIGQHVEAGDELGLVGATGNVTGPHLHFEVRFPDNSFHMTYNPELWIAPPQGWGVLAGRIMDTKSKLMQLLDVSVSSEERKDQRLVRTYGGGPVNLDPYYEENMVLGDLPAGLYKVTLKFDGKNRQTWMEIYPGQVTFFTFTGDKGYALSRPATPMLDILPPTATFSPASLP